MFNGLRTSLIMKTGDIKDFIVNAADKARVGVIKGINHAGQEVSDHKVTYGVGLGIAAVFALAAIALVALPACGVDISSVTDAAKDLANGTLDGAGSFLEAHSIELLAGGGVLAGVTTIAVTRGIQKAHKAYENREPDPVHTAFQKTFNGFRA